MRHYRRTSLMPRRRPKWRWLRQTINPTVAALTNEDLLSRYRTNAGISINLPDFTIWRIRIRVSIRITIAAAAGANDGVLFTVFTDSQSQTPVDQNLNSYDQRHMLFTVMPLAKYSTQSTLARPAAGTYMLYEEFDIKTHRKLSQMNETLFLQWVANSANTTINDISYTASVLLRGA